jgi:hemolysin activation/secretion protein
VLWGKINDFKVNGQTPGLRDSTRLFTAYPFAKDKILNMQDVDQMAENLMRVSERDNISVEPSIINGYSDLNLIHQPHFRLTRRRG